ncbi:MAG TPA: DUF2905 domain-containing protein [Anaerolineales bacterium]|nr:DUF2905 domain-containing protein [Anaerolineales bacterium]
MSLYTIARFFLIIGVISLVIAGGLFLAAKLGLPLGRLPGDIVIKRGNFTLAIPIVTSIVLSILLTVGINIIIRLLNR